MNIQRLKKFGILCVNIGEIPTAFSKALTYEEQLLFLMNYIENTVIPAINTNADILAEVKEKVDNFDSQYEELKAMIIEMREYVDEAVENIKKDYTEAMATFKEEIETIVNNNYVLLKNYIDLHVADLQEQIDHFDSKNVVVYDQTTGLYSPLQTVLDNIYNQTRENAITCSEFDALELTATEFDAKNISAYEFDQNGKILLTE